MEGYDETTYGEAFADVYDDWYHDVSDVDATVATLASLAARPHGRSRVLELGVGTGRLALPLAAAHRDRIDVVGIDASAAMLERFRARDTDALVEVCVGHMVDDLPPGPFDLAYVAYNTFFNLTDDGEQLRCFEAVADRMTSEGRFVIETFVPPDPPPDGDDIAIRSMSADRVVLSISRHEPGRRSAEGQFVELSAENGVRLRPWSIRYASPVELDDLARRAGFELESRWADMAGAPFTPTSDRHVSVYRTRSRSAKRDDPIATAWERT